MTTRRRGCHDYWTYGAVLEYQPIGRPRTAIAMFCGWRNLSASERRPLLLILHDDEEPEIVGYVAPVKINADQWVWVDEG